MELGEKDIQRFWRKVEKTDSCWIWTGTIDGWGRARMSIAGKLVHATRISWVLAGRNLSPYRQLNHLCNLSYCVNPDHLYEGTQLQNANDPGARPRGPDSITVGGTS